MREYTITMNFIIQSENADYDEVSEFAEQLTEDIMNTDKLIYRNDIEITDISVHNIEYDSYDEDNIYLENEDE